MAKVLAFPLPEKDPIILQQPCFANIAFIGPTGRSISCDIAFVSAAPNRSDHCRNGAEQPAACRNHSRFGEDLRRVSLVGVPPLEQAPGFVDWKLEYYKPGRPQSRLKAKLIGRPLGRAPERPDYNGEDHDDLTDQNFCRGHRGLTGISNMRRNLLERGHGA